MSMGLMEEVRFKGKAGNQSLGAWAKEQVPTVQSEVAEGYKREQ